MTRRFLAIPVLALAAFLAPEGSSRVRAGDDAATDGEELPIEYVFEGNSGVAGPDLQRALWALTADLKRGGVDDVAVDDAAYLLLRYYQSRGFPSAEIEPRWEAAGEGFRIMFRITEGPRTYLRSLRFAGNSYLSSEELAPCFDWERGILGLGTSVFARNKLDQGLDCVRSLYQLGGYYYVEADAVVDERDPQGVSVLVRITAGPRIEVRRPVAIEGVEAFPQGQIHRVMDVTYPMSFTPRLPAVLRGRVLEFYVTNGFPSAVVHVGRTIDREAGEARVTLEVQEGERARIRTILLPEPDEVESWDSVIDRYVILRPGDLYNEDLVRESTRGLIRSGLFESAIIEPRPVEARPDLVDLDVQVVEKPRFSVAALAGYGSWEQARGGVVFEYGNVFGSGHRLRLEGKASFKGEWVGVEHYNPFVFAERFQQDATVYYERRENRSFTEQNIVGDMGVGVRVTERLRGRFSYRLKDNNLLEVSPDIPPELDQEALTSAIQLLAGLDAREGFLDPRSGHYLRGSVEYSGEAIGSELHFLRGTLAVVEILPLFEGLRLVASGRAGVIARLPGTDVIPLQERFFLGGDTSIRSFRQDKAGPQSNGTPVGGESVLTFNLELRFPVGFLPVLEGLDGAIFGDTGTLNSNLEDFGGGRYFFGVGTGVRYKTPVGPLRLDLAFNPDQAPGEDLFVFHFALGYPF